MAKPKYAGVDDQDQSLHSQDNHGTLVNRSITATIDGIQCTADDLTYEEEKPISDEESDEYLPELIIELKQVATLTDDDFPEESEEDIDTIDITSNTTAEEESGDSKVRS